MPATSAPARGKAFPHHHFIMMPKLSHFLVGDGLHHLHVHFRYRRQPRDLRGNLRPMPELGAVSSCATARGKPLRFIIGVPVVRLDHRPRVMLPALTDLFALLKPAK